jgi:alpha-beta hydrolase superfamily lysophospholipase
MRSENKFLRVRLMRQSPFTMTAVWSTAVVEGFLESHGRSLELVVLLHAYRSTPAKLAAVRRTVSGAKPDADIFTPRLRLWMWSTEDPRALVRNVIEAIGDLDRRRDGGYSSITLVGHSYGAMLARKVFLDAPGAWAGRVSRIVLLAGMNRGWNATSALGAWQQTAVRFGTIVGHLLPGWPAIFALRRGAPFLTELRLQSLALPPDSGPLIVQLLGTQDDLVAPSDHVDLVTGANFLYLEVPLSGHYDVISMDDSDAGRARQCVFRDALLLRQTELKTMAIANADVDEVIQLSTDDFDTQTPAPAADVSDVIFVMHGIRDYGFWTKKIARDVKVVGREDGRVFRSVTSTYGYFAMAPFVLPWKRWEKVEWLLDEYVTARALYPNAERFSYVGHSNGTYLLAKALTECPKVRFDHVVFAGSVVRTDFDWSCLLGRGQVHKVLNFVAAADWVVAGFPKGLQTMDLQDLGSAGHDGFSGGPPDAISNIEYVAGHHAAALREDIWRPIAEFVVRGHAPQVPSVPRRSTLVSLLGMISPAVWAMLVAIGAGGLYLLAAAAVGLWVPDAVAGRREFAALQATHPLVIACAIYAYVMAIRFVLTRV